MTLFFQHLRGVCLLAALALCTPAHATERPTDFTNFGPWGGPLIVTLP